MIRVCVGNNISIPSLKLYEGSFEDFCSSISQIDERYAKSKTKQPFFCATADYEPLYKHGDNLNLNSEYNVIVIDGDSGINDKPIATEKEIHKFLVDRQLNHIVLSSWSKTAEKCKWRCIIQGVGVKQRTLEDTSRLIVYEMQLKGLSISYAYENHTRATAWFFGGMSNPELFKCYTYFDGQSLKPSRKRVMVVSAKEAVIEEKVGSSKEKTSDIIKTLKTGGDGYHLAQNKFSWMLVKDGVEKGVITAILKSMCEDWKEDTERWRERYNDIERSVESAVQKIKIKLPSLGHSIQGQAIKDGCSFSTPPGIVGEIVKEFECKMRYPLRQIAIIGVLHSLATFAGNHYRCKEIALTQKRVLLAKSGTGKNSILSWMNHLVVNAPVGLSFSAEKIKLVGHTDYTNSRTLHLELQEYPVKSIITSEAGQVGRTTAGDLARLSRHYLMILGNNFSDVLIPTGMAQTKGITDMKPLYNLNIQMLSESVPESYIENMIKQGDIGDGNLSRSELIYIDASMEENKVNYESDEYIVSKKTLGVYGLLFKRFCRVGNKDSTKYKGDCTEIQLEENVIKDYRELELLCLKESRGTDDEFDSALWNRRHVKTLKTAMILAIAESGINTDENEIPTPTITEEQWFWAKSYQTEICDVLDSKKKFGVFSDHFVILANMLRDKLYGVQENEMYMNMYNQEQREFNILTGSYLDKVLYRTKTFNDMCKVIHNGRRGDAIRSFLTYCIQIQLLYELTFSEAKRFGFKAKTYRFVLQ